jgi:hypothetical protein
MILLSLYSTSLNTIAHELSKLKVFKYALLCKVTNFNKMGKTEKMTLIAH